MTRDDNGLTLRQAAEQARWLLITLHPHHPLKILDDCINALSKSLGSDCEANFQNPEYEAGYSNGYRDGFDNGRDIGFEEGSDRLLFNTITHGHFNADLASDECEYHKQRAALWRHEAYRLGGTPLPWDADEAIAKAVAAERERIKQVNAPEIEKINAYIKALEDAVAAEREACAQIADEWATREQKQFGNGGPGAAIRARGGE